MCDFIVGYLPQRPFKRCFSNLAGARGVRDRLKCGMLFLRSLTLVNDDERFVPEYDFNPFLLVPF
jgi:hypothetical protein